MTTAQREPSDMETKTFITGASDKEVNIGYSAAPVPFKDGMADGLTPGTTNTPGPYETPATTETPAAAESPETSETTPETPETGKTSTGRKTAAKS